MLSATHTDPGDLICPPTHVGSYEVMNDLKFAFRQLLKNSFLTVAALHSRAGHRRPSLR
jgi:hypothetical protein